MGLAVVFTVIRLATKSPPGPAISGLIATVAAAALALFTGRAEDNFIPGFITNVLYGSAFLVSALIGWSLIGLAVGFLMGEGTAWRKDKRKRRVFFWLAIAWAGLFAARLAVQVPLYFAGRRHRARHGQADHGPAAVRAHGGGHLARRPRPLSQAEGMIDLS